MHDTVINRDEKKLEDNADFPILYKNIMNYYYGKKAAGT